MTARAYLVDSSMYVFRAWFTMPADITDTDGNPANAVYGFTDFVYKLLTEVQPENIAFAFDKSLTSCYRNELYPPYKANRPPAPEELVRQFHYCREFVDVLGMLELASRVYEADDIIGTLAQRAREQGLAATIISGDKDMAQLLKSDHDLLWDYAKNRKLDRLGVERQFGVRPEQIADLLAIAGDKVDNIPGVPGIGMTTALRLLERFDDIEQLLEKVELVEYLKIRGAERTQRLLKEHQHDLRLFRKLTQIQECADLPHALDMKPRGVDQYALEDLFTRLGFSDYRQERWHRLAGNWVASV